MNPLFPGFTLLAYVNIESANNNQFLGYISSMVRINKRYGTAVYGFRGSLWYFYRPQTKFAKGMFLHVSVCPQGVGCLPHCMLGYTPSLCSTCWNMVYKRAVRIPLECNLANSKLQWRVQGGAMNARPRSPNSFIFMQFSATSL